MWKCCAKRTIVRNTTYKLWTLSETKTVGLQFCKCCYKGQCWAIIFWNLYFENVANCAPSQAEHQTYFEMFAMFDNVAPQAEQPLYFEITENVSNVAHLSG